MSPEMKVAPNAGDEAALARRAIKEQWCLTIARAGHIVRQEEGRIPPPLGPAEPQPTQRRRGPRR
jgi:hypothetical protein